MIVATDEQGERRTNAFWIRCIIGLMVLSFIGCQAPEPEAVEFKPSGVDWELQEEILEAIRTVDWTRNRRPVVEGQGEVFGLVSQREDPESVRVERYDGQADCLIKCLNRIARKYVGLPGFVEGGVGFEKSRPGAPGVGL